MPIYEFECPVHGRFEKYLPIVPYGTAKYIPCTESLNCGKRAVKVYSSFNTTQEGKPTHFFRNPQTGEIRTLIQDKEKYNPPHGFVLEEAKGQIERLKLEKTLSQRAQVENEIVTHERREMKDATTKNRHADINANLSKYDHGTQELLKESMKRSRRKELPAKKTEIKFAINHTNQSNLEG